MCQILKKDIQFYKHDLKPHYEHNRCNRLVCLWLLCITTYFICSLFLFDMIKPESLICKYRCMRHYETSVYNVRHALLQSIVTIAIYHLTRTRVIPNVSNNQTSYRKGKSINPVAASMYGRTRLYTVMRRVTTTLSPSGKEQSRRKTNGQTVHR